MNKKINILNKFKLMIINNIKEKENLKNEKKNRIMYLLNRTWTEEQIIGYNDNLIRNTAGTLGGGYTEQEIKRSILRENADLFETEEYDMLYEKLQNKKSI